MEVTEIRAVVRAVDGDAATVEVLGGGCGRCHEPGGCGGQQLTQMLCGSAKTYEVANGVGARVGDEVTVGIPAGAVRFSANLAYGLPLVSLIAGALLGMEVRGEPGAMIGAVLGLLAAWTVMRLKARRPLEKLAIRPQILSSRSTLS